MIGWAALFIGVLLVGAYARSSIAVLGVALVCIGASMLCGVGK